MKTRIQEQLRTLEVWTRPISGNYRTCICSVDISRCSSGPCIVDTFRNSTDSFCPVKSRCNSCCPGASGEAQAPCGVDTSRCCIGLCNVDTSGCRSVSYDVDMSRCHLGQCVVDTSRKGTDSFCADKSRCNLCCPDTSSCSSGPCGKDQTRCSIGLCSVDMSTCSSAPCDVDTSRPAQQAPVVQTCPGPGVSQAPLV
jgi:hypothetical protein